MWMCNFGGNISLKFIHHVIIIKNKNFVLEKVNIGNIYNVKFTLELQI